MDTFKQQLLDRIDFTAEVTELLGNGKGTTRRCWNSAAHDDTNPSLSFNPSHGGWRCHGCSETGDLFTLYQKVHSVGFPEAYRYFLQKYGLWDEVVDWKKSRNYTTKKKLFSAITDQDVKFKISSYVARWRQPRYTEKLAFMYIRYGLTLETLERWKLGPGNDGRIWIPIWSDRSVPEDGRSTIGRLPSFVNVRRHDVFRVKCQWWNIAEGGEPVASKPEEISVLDIANQDFKGWKPLWTDRSGKVISQARHGATYLYPAEVLQDNSMVYVVGGELKALLLNQLGLPAVTFTTGEGSLSEEWLPYFIGKRVRICMDADPEKYDADKYPEGNPTEKKKEVMAQIFADAGALVEVLDWPNEVVSRLPVGGDVTDLLRLCNWNPQGLEMMPWRRVERRLTEQEVADIPVISATKDVEPEWDNTRAANFHDLVDPRSLNEWMKVRALVSGLNETPFVVPSEVTAVCHMGMANMQPKCASCRLMENNFRRQVKFSVDTQVSMVGQTDPEKLVREVLGIPKRCYDPVIEITPASVQVAILTPTIEVEAGSDVGERFEHRVSYLVGKDRIRVRENVAYDIKGKVIPDPKRGTFTLSASEWRDVEDDVFTFNKSQEGHKGLTLATEGKSAEVKRDRLIGDVRDHIVQQIIGQDQMIEVSLISFFMPFVFRLGPQIQERVCPAVMILGDTMVGKSTATNKIRRHFGAGRMYAADADPTHAGLIGGMLQLSSKNSSFHWGVVPTSHGGWLALDEYNKLSLDTIGKMTNVISSGIAERLTVSGPRRTRAWVRFLYLANPRGDRALTSFSNLLDAAIHVSGTVQDLGRIDLVHIQPKLRNSKVYGQLLSPSTDHRYNKSVSRYHLQWAWSRDMDDYLFEDVGYIFRQSMLLADRFGGSAVLLPAQARFKLARIAAAYAVMLYSHMDDFRVLVTNEHVDLAADLITRCYAPYLNPSSKDYTGTLPTELINVMGKVRTWRRLRLLVNSEKWSDEDLRGAFRHNYQEFIDVAQYEFGLISKRNGWYTPKDRGFCDNIQEYLNSRSREDMMRSEAKKYT